MFLGRGKSSQTVLAEHPSLPNRTEPGNDPEDVIGVNHIEGRGFERSTLKRFRDNSSINETFRVVMEYIRKDWTSEKEQVDELSSEYWSFRGELTVEE